MNNTVVTVKFENFLLELNFFRKSNIVASVLHKQNKILLLLLLLLLLFTK